MTGGNETPASTRAAHWQSVYATRPSDAVSWYRPHLERSLAWIERLPPGRRTPLIDVGAGASTLVDDLLARGCRDVTVLDLAPQALAQSRERLGPAAAGVTWLAADVLEAHLPAARYAVWHDRAVFHFLTDAADRARYVAQLRHALQPGGHAIIATFGPQGPTRCSGLDVMRHDAPSLAAQLGRGFVLRDSTLETHHTPGGTGQQFLYTLFQYTGTAAP